LEKSIKNRELIEKARACLSTGDIMNCFDVLQGSQGITDFIIEQTENLKQQFLRNVNLNRATSEYDWLSHFTEVLAMHIDILGLDITDRSDEKLGFRLKSVLTLELSGGKTVKDILDMLDHQDLVRIDQFRQEETGIFNEVILHLSLVPSMTYRLKYVFAKGGFPWLIDYKVTATAWNTYLEKIISLDMIDTYTHRKDLEGIDLSNRFLSYSSFENTNLGGAILDGAYFNGSNFAGVNLKGARMKETRFSNAQIEGSNLEGADLNHITLYKANLEGVNFQGAILDGAYMDEANLTGANLNRVLGAELVMRKANLEHTSLLRICLLGADLRFSNLSFANCQEAIFDYAILDHVNGSEANFKGSSFIRANLEGVNFTGANLNQVRFERARLIEVNFEKAILTGSNFLGARIGEINLKNANLLGAVFPVSYKAELIAQGIDITDVLFR